MYKNEFFDYIYKLNLKTMADLNKVMLIGRITSDLEVKKMWNSWNSVLNFSLATNRSYKSKTGEKIEETEFTRCVVFGKLADVMWQYLSKWRKIFVEGRLRTKQWEDQSGNKRYTTEVIVSEMNFCDKGNGWNSNWNTANANANVENEIADDIPF